MREILAAFSELIRSEIHLTKVELAFAARKVGSQGPSLLGGGLLALFGSLSLIAFLVIGFGELLGRNYWLSALLVGALLVGAGAFLILGAAKKISQVPLKPSSIQGLQNDRELIANSAKESIRRIA